jgi:hypothetical protein
VRLTADFKKRDFSDPISFPDVSMVVNRYSWMAQGGPDEVSITAYGHAERLWELMEWLRAPLEILDETGEAVWWGYVDEVRIRMGAVEMGVSLSGMYNRVAVPFSLLNPSDTGPGVRSTTSWAQDDDSVGEYGTKELLSPLDEGTLAQAEQHRDTVLQAFRYPVPVPRVVERGASSEAAIVGLGWWYTLNWQYYANTGDSSVVTTTQIADIVTGEGQFLTGTDVVDASGISTNEYRDGDGLAGDVVLTLLDTGTSNKRRLLATVTRDRELRVYEEPAYDAYQTELFVDASGVITNRWGNAWIAQTQPTGRWVEFKGVIPPTLDVTRLSDPRYFLCERASFNSSTERWTPEPKGIPSPWDFAKMREG